MRWSALAPVSEGVLSITYSRFIATPGFILRREVKSRA